MEGCLNCMVIRAKRAQYIKSNKLKSNKEILDILIGPDIQLKKRKHKRRKHHHGRKNKKNK